MSYDSNLVIGSACIAVIICYVAISLEQLIFTQHTPSSTENYLVFKWHGFWLRHLGNALCRNVGL